MNSNMVENNDFNYVDDQTHFAEEQPMLDAGFGESEPQEPLTPEQLKRRKWLKIGGGIAAIVVVFVVGAMIMIPTKKTSTAQSTPTPSPATATRSKNDVEQKLDELSDELEAADPAKPPITFPIVNMDIRIQTKR